ncbi:DUF6286 domain-containing protein [Streptomyces sp. NPDC048111]|uniref:DUF6286 domain-containing protein n=1 Tax=Streptomyces sp. NPDC048111 TaxID=3365500 RepID=UPI00371CC050
MTEGAGRGCTVVADKVVRKIAEQAALEALAAGRAARPSGSATVHGRWAEVSLRLALPYPAPLEEGVRHVQEHVTARTRRLTGLEISRPRLTVTRLTARGTAVPPEPSTAGLPTGGPPARTARRCWSPRRFPLAVLLLLFGSACAATTADMIRVHALGTPAGAWRMNTVAWLAGHRPGAPAVTGAAIATAAAGLWMLTLALTPGRRGRLGVTAPAAHRSVTVDRSTVASLVRDAVSEVEGVAPVRVRMGRRRLSVRADLAFGDEDAARRRAADATQRVLASCLLRREPRQKITVTARPGWRPSAPAGDAPGKEKGPRA